MSTPRGIPRAAYRFGRFPKPATFLRGLEDYMSASTDIVLRLPKINDKKLKELQAALRRYLEKNPYNDDPKRGWINVRVSLGTLGIGPLSLALRGSGQTVFVGICRMDRHHFDATGTRIWLRTVRYCGMKRSAVICVNFADKTVTVDRTFKEFLDSHQKEVTPALTPA